MRMIQKKNLTHLLTITQSQRETSFANMNTLINCNEMNIMKMDLPNIFSCHRALTLEASK